MLTTDQHPSILVTAARGKTGRRVANGLERAGSVPRRAGRHSRPPLDWADASSWPEALDGIQRVYLAYAPDLAVPGAVDTVTAFVGAAQEHGVERIVLLSGRGEEAAEAVEDVVVRSGLEWTILRCSWFMQNFSEDYLAEAVLAGSLALPASSPEPFVDVDDIAEVAVAALLDDGHVGERYELTGPEALSFGEVAVQLASATGRRLTHQDVPLTAYVDGLRAHGLPEEVVALLGYLFGEVLDGRNSRPQDGVERALGRPPRTFSQYAAAAAANGAWAQPVEPR